MRTTLSSSTKSGSVPRAITHRRGASNTSAREGSTSLRGKQRIVMKDDVPPTTSSPPRSPAEDESSSPSPSCSPTDMRTLPIISSAEALDTPKKLASRTSSSSRTPPAQRRPALHISPSPLRSRNGPPSSSARTQVDVRHESVEPDAQPPHPTIPTLLLSPNRAAKLRSLSRAVSASVTPRGVPSPNNSSNNINDDDGVGHGGRECSQQSMEASIRRWRSSTSSPLLADVGLLAPLRKLPLVVRWIIFVGAIFFTQFIVLLCGHLML